MRYLFRRVFCIVLNFTNVFGQLTGWCGICGRGGDYILPLFFVFEYLKSHLQQVAFS